MQCIKTGKILGANIRRIRKSRKITQEQLAAQLQIYGCDISRGTLAKIEAGIRHITLDELKAIKFVLQIEYDEFFAEGVDILR